MCMIYDDKGNVLVENKRVNDKYGIIFPGGHIEDRESIVDSVRREVWEETGLTIGHIYPCGVKDWVEEDGSRYLVFLYKTNDYSGTLKSSKEGNVFWIPLKDLCSLELLWHLEKMLYVFCKDNYSEIYFDRKGSSTEPILK